MNDPIYIPVRAQPGMVQFASASPELSHIGFGGFDVPKFLVTGGGGLIGSHLCDELQSAGHTVRILDDLSTGKRENVPSVDDVLVGDVADENVVRKAMEGVDGCFHLAAISSVQRSNEEWALTHRVNLTGTINVLDAARNTGGASPVPVVYASTAAV